MYIIQTNLYAALIALIILFSLYSQRDFTQLNHRQFYRMTILTILLLLMDMVAELTNGQPGMLAWGLHRSSLVFGYGAAGFVGVYWFMYIYHHLYGHRPLAKLAKVLLIVPALVLLLLAIVSLFGNMLFIIDEDNVYQRGRFFIVNVVFMYGYATLALITLARHIRSMPRRDVLPLMSVPIFPMLGGVVQILYYGVLLLWPMTVLSLLVVYIFIQSKRVGIDTLTRLLNRHEFDLQIRTMPHGRKGHETYAAMMIDIDAFKTINDTYGHHVGDQVLRFVGKTLKAYFDPNQTIYRIGGDEFFIFFNRDPDVSLKEIVEAVKEAVSSSHPFSFAIQLSIGAADYEPSWFGDFLSFVAHVDMMMYADKRRHRQNANETDNS
ncbi:MAG: GGDEF domain-containing protein [Acholeplasmatales bacterium]|nr:MAG: GGDEF domain-containing protein [Acholeplasmatales bacterium]